MLLQDALAVLHVLVLEDFDGRFRKPRSVDDRGVIQLIGNNQIVISQYCRNRSRVGGESRLKYHACFHVLEGRDLLL